MNNRPTISNLDRLAQATSILSAVYDTGGFAAAAARLHLDPSAVSHRVRTLESALGYKLFQRTTRQMQPTRAGKLICDAAVRSRDNLDAALAAVANLRSSSTLRLSLPSSVAMKWLIPHLPDACQNGLDVSVDVDEEVAPLGHLGSDAAIRFGPGPYPGQHATKLASCWLQPVASPAYLKSLGADGSLIGLRHARFLADRRGEADNTDYCWAAYLEGDEVTLDVQSSLHLFERADLMLQAAIGGLGIGLGRTLLIEQDIEHGLLAAIGPLRRSRSSYWFVTSHELAQTDRIQSVRKWLRKRVDDTRKTLV